MQNILSVQTSDSWQDFYLLIFFTVWLLNSLSSFTSAAVFYKTSALFEHPDILKPVRVIAALFLTFGAIRFGYGIWGIFSTFLHVGDLTAISWAGWSSLTLNFVLSWVFAGTVLYESNKMYQLNDHQKRILLIAAQTFANLRRETAKSKKQLAAAAD